MGPTEALRCIARARAERGTVTWRQACDRCAREVIYTRTENVERKYLHGTYAFLCRQEEAQAPGGAA